MANQHELVVEAVKAQLQTISAGAEGYAYTPDAVLRISFLSEDWAPDASFTTVYYLAPESETKRLGPSSCESTSLLTLGILACRKLESPSENPKEENPERWRVGNEMFADIAQAIYANPTFNGTARFVFDTSITADYQRFLPGWALVFVRFVVMYATNRPGR